MDLYLTPEEGYVIGQSPAGYINYYVWCGILAKRELPLPKFAYQLPVHVAGNHYTYNY